MELIIPKHVVFKLKAWRDMGSTEVTGFFISEKDNMNHIIDAQLVEASCTVATVHMEPEALAAFYQEQMKKKFYPDQLQVWWHTHPGSSASPSGTDQATFRDLGKDRTFNMMYILARGGEEFAQLSVTDKKSQYMIKEPMTIGHPMEEWVDFEDYEILKKKYDECVLKSKVVSGSYVHPGTPTPQFGFDTSYPSTKQTQREIFEQNSSQSGNPESFEELDAEYENAASFPDFLLMVENMVEDDDVSEDDLNQWFRSKNLKTQFKNGVFV